MAVTVREKDIQLDLYTGLSGVLGLLGLPVELKQHDKTTIKAKLLANGVPYVLPDKGIVPLLIGIRSDKIKLAQSEGITWSGNTVKIDLRPAFVSVAGPLQLELIFIDSESGDTISTFVFKAELKESLMTKDVPDTPDSYPLVIVVPPSSSGGNGLSAYELAVQNGFAGTEQEWLDSLKGKAATVSVGDTTTVAAGQPAKVTERGTPQARIFDFAIPEGRPGTNAGSDGGTGESPVPAAINVSAYGMIGVGDSLTENGVMFATCGRVYSDDAGNVTITQSGGNVSLTPIPGQEVTILNCRPESFNGTFRIKAYSAAKGLTVYNPDASPNTYAETAWTGASTSYMRMNYHAFGVFHGYLSEALSLAKYAPDWIYNYGAGSSAAFEWASGKEVIGRSNAKFVHILLGTNDLSQGRTFTQITNSLYELVTYCLSEGRTVILGTIPPRKNVSGLTMQVNDWIRRLGENKDIIIADYYAALVNPKNGACNTDYFGSDGLHQNGLGSRVMGQVLAEVFDKIFRTRSILPTTQGENRTNSISMYSDPLMMDATKDSTEANVTGKVSSETKVTVTGGSAVSSVVENPDFSGNMLSVKFTPSANGQTVSIINTPKTTGALTLKNDADIILAAEFSFDNPTATISASMTFTLAGITYTWALGYSYLNGKQVILSQPIRAFEGQTIANTIMTITVTANDTEPINLTFSRPIAKIIPVFAMEAEEPIEPTEPDEPDEPPPVVPSDAGLFFSNGASINTTFALWYYHTIECGFTTKTTTKRGYLFGGRLSASQRIVNQFAAGIASPFKWSWGKGTNQLVWVGNAIDMDVRHEVVLSYDEDTNLSTIKFDDNAFSTEITETTHSGLSQPLWIGGVYGAPANQEMEGIIHYLRIKDRAGTVLAEYLPAKSGETYDGTVAPSDCLYEAVSKKFLTNTATAGTLTYVEVTE